MSKNNKRWFAFVIGFNNEINKTVASCLAFDALNRFEALKMVEKTLPEHENWVSSDGQLIAFTVVALEQCRPGEEAQHMERFVESFARAAGQEPDFEGFWSSPPRDDP